MESYNIPKDQGYKVSNSYGPIEHVNANYGGAQSQSVILPVYQAKQNKAQISRKSKCPRGAPLGSIGSCCGMACTRACAISD